MNPIFIEDIICVPLCFILLLINFYQIYNHSRETPAMNKLHHITSAICSSLICVMGLRLISLDVYLIYTINILIDLSSMILFICIIQTNRYIINAYSNIRFYQASKTSLYKIIDIFHLFLIILEILGVVMIEIVRFYYIDNRYIAGIKIINVIILFCMILTLNIPLIKLHRIYNELNSSFVSKSAIKKTTKIIIFQTIYTIISLVAILILLLSIFQSLTEKYNNLSIYESGTELSPSIYLIITACIILTAFSFKKYEISSQNSPRLGSAKSSVISNLDNKDGKKILIFILPK